MNGPPDEKTRRLGVAPGLDKPLQGEPRRADDYAGVESYASDEAGNVLDFKQRWFRLFERDYPEALQRLLYADLPEAVVVSNAWGFGVPGGCWTVSIRQASAGRAPHPFGRATYLLTFNDRADAMVFADRIAAGLSLLVWDWTEDVAPAETGSAA